MASTPYVSNFTEYGQKVISPALIGTAATDKVGFYGTTPATQPTSANQAAVTVTAVTALATTVFSAVDTGKWGFSSSTVAKTFQPRINQCVVDIGAINTELTAIRSALVALGLIKGS